MPEPGVKNNLVIALLYSGQYQQAKSELSTEPKPQGAQALSIVITALSNNSARAVIEAKSAFPEEKLRASVLTSAGIMLMQLRQYSGARDLMKAADKLLNRVDSSWLMSSLEKAKPSDQLVYQADDPRFPVLQILLKAISDKLDPSEVRPLFSKRVDWVRTESELPTFRRMVDIYRTLQMRGGETRPEVMLDFALGSLNLKKEGEDGIGYHISDSEEFSSIPSFYVILEDGQYRILGWSRSLGAVGALILELIEKQDVKSAQRWLDEVVHDLNSMRGASNRPAVRLLWSGVVESTRGAEAATAAAASLIGQDYVSEKAISLLKERSSKTKDKMDRAQIDLALCESLEKSQKWGDLLITAQNLSAYQIYENDSFYFTTAALRGLKRWNELSGEAEKQLKKKPDDSRAVRMMATALVNMGKYDEAATCFKKMVGRIMDFSELPYAAWGLMLIGKADEQTLKDISQFGISNSSDYFYATGALKVLLDRSDEAQRSLNSALDLDEPLNAKAWALRGRILESYGLADDAKAAYEKMQAFKNNDEETNWAIRVLTGRTNR